MTLEITQPQATVEDQITEPQSPEVEENLLIMEAAIRSWAASATSIIASSHRQQRATVLKVPDNIKNYLAERYINTEYKGKPGTMTVSNPNKVTAETIIKAAFAQHGWSAKVSKNVRSGGFSASSRSETTIEDVNVMITQLG